MGGYYVAASAVAAGDVNRARKAVRSLTLPGPKRIHFTDERDDRRKKLLKEFSALDTVVNVYVARGLRDKEARPLCLGALARDAAASGADHLSVEKDESSYAHDKKIIGQALQSSENRPRYDFPRAHEETLLWVSDAVAWCYQKRGRWTGLAAPLVADVVELT